MKFCRYGDLQAFDQKQYHPVCPPDDEAWLTLFKKPRLFDYDGCVWHHLRRHVPPRVVLAAYGTTWVYTSMRDFERALRRAGIKVVPAWKWLLKENNG